MSQEMAPLQIKLDSDMNIYAIGERWVQRFLQHHQEPRSILGCAIETAQERLQLWKENRKMWS